MSIALPASVYTANRGYAWSTVPVGLDETSLGEFITAAQQLRSDFPDATEVTRGVIAVGTMAAVFTIRRALNWDAEGRDADYAAFAFLSCDKASSIDIPHLLEDNIFQMPTKTPAGRLVYNGPASSPAPLTASGRLLCHRRLESFDPHAIGDLLAKNFTHCDRWTFAFSENATCTVTTSPWHR